MFGLAAKLRQVALIDLPGSPGFSQVTMANGQVVITRPGTNTIEIFSPVKRRVIARISQISDPRGIAVDNESGYHVRCAGGEQQHCRDRHAELERGKDSTRAAPAGKAPVGPANKNALCHQRA